MKLSDLIEVFKGHDKVLFKLTGIGETEYGTIEFKDAIDTIEALQQENEQLRAQVARMRKAIQKYILSIEKQYSIEDHHKCPICGIFTKTEYCHLCVTKELINAMSDTVQDYHNPADVEALRKAREALRIIFKKHTDIKNHDKYPKTHKICAEALAEIDKVIGGKEDARRI